LWYPFPRKAIQWFRTTFLACAVIGKLGFGQIGETA